MVIEYYLPLPPDAVTQFEKHCTRVEADDVTFFLTWIVASGGRVERIAA